jgi:hypothetical protein
MPGSTSATAPAAAFLSMALRVSGVLINPVPVLDPCLKIEASCFRDNSPHATGGEQPGRRLQHSPPLRHVPWEAQMIAAGPRPAAH